MIPGEQQECSLYRFYVWDPATNYTTKTVGYIGETARMPIARLVEHLKDKPWGDTIAGWDVDDCLFDGKESVWAAERAAVEAELPLYNDEYNRGNPRRVDYETQVEQRHTRDRAKGRPLWQPGRPVRAARRSRSRVTSRPTTRSSGVVGRWWASARWPVLGHVAAWLALSAVVWWFVTADVTVSAGAGAGLLFGGRLVVWFAGLSRRRRRQVVRLAVAVVVAALVVVGWLASR